MIKAHLFRNREDKTPHQIESISDNVTEEGKELEWSYVPELITIWFQFYPNGKVEFVNE